LSWLSMEESKAFSGDIVPYWTLDLWMKGNVQTILDFLWPFRHYVLEDRTLLRRVTTVLEDRTLLRRVTTVPKDRGQQRRMKMHKMAVKERMY
jgi:hypothetical protein